MASRRYAFHKHGSTWKVNPRGKTHTHTHTNCLLKVITITMISTTGQAAQMPGRGIGVKTKKEIRAILYLNMVTFILISRGTCAKMYRQ